MSNIILLGPPGSGKGTQSKLLVENQSFFQISTGDLLRKTVESGSNEGKKIQKIMEKGDLVSDEMVIDMILRAMALNSEKKFIFDGFPRNIAQAEALEKAFKDKTMTIDYVILLEVKLDFLENRIKKRLSETDPKNRRTDDNILTLQKRLGVYKEMTLPIISFYQEREKLIKINGMESIEEVNKKIISILN